jgi:putative Ca2+/H+ antiporter (TMEM165/GDT1 family)
MHAFLVSLGVVAVSEIGDKTQLLALMLAARFRRPVPIIMGIVTATLFNHALAGALGAWIASSVDPTILRWILGLLFIAMGAWALIPDTLDENKGLRDAATPVAVFLVTTVAFFLAEIGDKTQIATAALAARFASLVPVILGTTCGMLLADVPAVLFAQLAAEKIRFAWVRYVAAALFIGLGLATIFAFAL